MSDSSLGIQKEETRIQEKEVKKKFYLLSDIHLEFHGDNFKTIDMYLNVPEDKTDNILILAGDIGYPFEPIFTLFIESCCSKFEMVFHVAGNHEYYDCELRKITMTDVKEQLRKYQSSIPNYIFLDNEIFVLDNGLMIVGTTLWSAINPLAARLIKDKINDYRNIYTSVSPIVRLTPSMVDDFHQENREWLKRVLVETDHKKLVISHHLPSTRLINDKFKGSVCNYAYASDDNDLFSGANIVLWCFGHSHSCEDRYISGVRCVSNTVGYPHERTGYRKTAIFYF